MSHMRAYAIYAREKLTTDKKKAPVHLTIYQPIEFGAHGQESWEELARFLKYCIREEQEFVLRAAVDACAEPFRDRDEEAASVRAVPNFVPTKRLHGTAPTPDALALLLLISQSKMTRRRSSDIPVAVDMRSSQGGCGLVGSVRQQRRRRHSVRCQAGAHRARGARAVGNGARGAAGTTSVRPLLTHTHTHTHTDARMHACMHACNNACAAVHVS